MGKVLGIGAIVVAMWLGMEVYTKGAANAFGGALSAIGLAEKSESGRPDQSPAQRAGSSVAGAHERSDARRESLLAE